MQYSNKDYNPERHDRWRALTVKQPYANDLVTEAYKDENGIVYGKKTIEVRSKNTSYRGDVLICSAASPVYPGMESGVTLGLVELYDVKPIKKSLRRRIGKTPGFQKKRGRKITKGYGWLMRNPAGLLNFRLRAIGDLQFGLYQRLYIAVPRGNGNG